MYVSYGNGGSGIAWQGVNGDTEVELAPVCELASVTKGFMQRTCGLREKVGSDVPIC